MRVLEVGGSLPREFVLDILGAEAWVGVEAMRYWEELGEEGGDTRPPKDISLKIKDLKDISELGSHRILEGQVEDLPKAMECAFDRIFSIACFEHIHTLGLALEKTHTALKPGGKLFTMLSPIWSTHDGHHLPGQNHREHPEGSRVEIPREKEFCQQLDLDGSRKEICSLIFTTSVAR
jgi:SAM-dependent methyltransferase